MIPLLLAVNLGALVVYFQLSSFCPRHVKHKYENTKDQSKQLVIMIAVTLFIENISLQNNITLIMKQYGVVWQNREFRCICQNIQSNHQTILIEKKRGLFLVSNKGLRSSRINCDLDGIYNIYSIYSFPHHSVTAIQPSCLLSLQTSFSKTTLPPW